MINFFSEYLVYFLLLEVLLSLNTGIGMLTHLESFEIAELINFI